MIDAALPNMLAGLTAGLASILPTTPSTTITVLSVPSMTPITNALPDIPRSYTAICEWAACMVYIAVLYRRVPLQRSIIVSAAGLLLLTAVQYFDGSMPIWFWIIGMLLAFACMYATILLGAGTGKREGLYITARAFVLAELVASLHWQIVTFIGMRDGFADYDWPAIVLLVVTYALCFSLAWLVERGNFSQTAPTLPTASAAIATMAIMIVTFAMSNRRPMITNALPDIPRSYTAICEWAACMVYIAVLYRRVPLRRSIIVSAVGLPAIVAVQYFDGSMPIWFWIVGMLLAFGCMYLTILFGAGTGKREGLYITARAFVLAELVASLHWQIVAFIGTHDAQATSYGVQAIVMLIVIYALCFGLAWLVERGNFSQTTPTLPTASAATATVAITIVTFAMSNLSFVSTNTPFSGSMGQEIFYIRTLVDFCGFAILYAQQEQARRIEASAEIASINAQLESQHQEYLQSKENIESLGRLAHDLKHQIAALRAEVDPEHAAAGFEQLEKSVQRYSAQQHTGNPVLDVILTTKERTCADRGISFTAVADGSLLSNMSSMDIASLFGNALDNAIEATLKLPNPEQRLIKLALFEQNHFIVIRVENYYDSRLSKDADGNLRTTKRDDQHRHGFGVKSIRHIAQQYGGEVTIRTDNHWFVLTALIPRRTGLMAM